LAVHLEAKKSSEQLETNDVLVAILIPICRLVLEGGIGIDQFVHAVKQAYVKTAMADVLPYGSRPNVSRLAVATGLTRKEVSLLVDTVSGKVSPARSAKEQRATRVLRAWCADPRFRGKSGQPALLSIRRGKAAFSQLVKLYAGDVTPISVLRELERMKAISTTKDGMVRMLPSASRFPAHPTQHMLEIASLLTDFADIIVPGRVNRARQGFFGYRERNSVSSEDIAVFNRSFSRRATALLDGFEQWQATRRNSQRKSNLNGRLGIGVYLVALEEPSGAAHPLRRRVRKFSESHVGRVSKGSQDCNG
jgi:Family of unknown function (DUF6502)